MFSDEVKTVVEKLSITLSNKELMLVTAESCTGGLIAGAMTNRAGSSSVFERGFVTYSNRAKIEMLGVSEKTLEDYGAVSAEVAEEMAAGALKQSSNAVSVAVTGIAGPDGGSEEKPVGLVYTSVSFNRETSSFKKIHEGNRVIIRNKTIIYALNKVLEVLNT